MISIMSDSTCYVFVIKWRFITLTYFKATKSQYSVVFIWFPVSGYLQANVAILPNHLASYFEAFCRSNPAPLPLLYCSQSGETSCQPLAKEADIRYWRFVRTYFEFGNDI